METKVRHIVQEVSLCVFVLSIFTWLLTGFEMLFIPARGLMTVINITKEFMLWSMVAFMGSSWYGSIKRTVRRIKFRILED